MGVLLVDNYLKKNLEKGPLLPYLQFTTVTENFGNRRICNRDYGSPSKDGSNSRKHQVSKYKGAS